MATSFRELTDALARQTAENRKSLYGTAFPTKEEVAKRDFMN